jgi:hypothetical protein
MWMEMMLAGQALTSKSLDALIVACVSRLKALTLSWQKWFVRVDKCLNNFITCKANNHILINRTVNLKYYKQNTLFRLKYNNM